MSDHDPFVLVLDIEIKTRTPGLTLNYTVREHEGDELFDNPASVAIRFGEKTVIVDGGQRQTRRSVSIPRDCIAEEQRTSRWERRQRLSVADIIDKDAAEVARLAAQFGVAMNPNS